MSINANRLVSISPRVIAGGSADLETNGLVLSKSALIPANPAGVSFSSAAAVADYFGAESAEADFARQYFSGVNNQQKGVSTLWVGRRVDAAASAWLRGVPSVSLADLKKVKDGSLKVTLNGTDKVVTGVDFSSAKTWSDIATTLATAITGVSGAYDSNLKALTFTTTATGADADISVAVPAGSGTDVSASLGLTEGTGAVASPGSEALTPAANMDAICAASMNWVGFTTLYEADEAEALALAAWADINDDFVYFDWQKDPAMLSSLTNQACKAAKLADYNCAAALYGDAQDAAFYLAIGASIDWSREQGIKTWFAKTTSGLSPNVLSDAQADALDSIRCNYLGKFATRNADFKLLNRGYLTGKLYGFIDCLYGMIWFKARLQRSIMDGMVAVNRAPYTPKGYALVSAWMLDPINAAKKNGIIDTGLLLSESQKAQIANEVGQDISDTLFAQGYWYRVEDPDASVRADRGTPVIDLFFTYAGSIQRVAFPLVQIQ